EKCYERLNFKFLQNRVTIAIYPQMILNICYYLTTFEVQILTKIRQNYEYLQTIFSIMHQAYLLCHRKPFSTFEIEALFRQVMLHTVYTHNKTKTHTLFDSKKALQFNTDSRFHILYSRIHETISKKNTNSICIKCIYINHVVKRYALKIILLYSNKQTSKVFENITIGIFHFIFVTPNACSGGFRWQIEYPSCIIEAKT
ncbi:hypothetical protein AGLY_014270, partial [Aphis glycines]